MHFNPATDDQTAANDARSHVETWLQVLDNFLSVGQGATVDTEVDIINPSTGQLTGALTVTSTLITGGSADNPLPNATAGLVRWRTGSFSGGRELRGRTFIPGITEASNDANGNPSSTMLSAINAGSLALITNSALAVWSPTYGSVAPATSTSMWTEFAVLRSRRD
jgi:hypothetical protein